ncbi:MAG: triosephosphate isomerase, partial [Candidatus Omnitrophota bacterium]
MFKKIDEAIKLAAEIKRELLDCKEVDIVLCPPFTSLYSVHEIIMETDIQLGAQDTFWEREGAYTGEISAAMLKDCGASFTIIGHSERRQYFFETDETVNKKIKAALHIGLRPIVCIGETLGEREEAKTTIVVQTQLEGSLKGLNEQELSKIIIAYEPV